MPIPADMKSSMYSKNCSEPELRSRNGWSTKRIVDYENTQIFVVLICNILIWYIIFTKNTFVSRTDYIQTLLLTVFFHL